MALPKITITRQPEPTAAGREFEKPKAQTVEMKSVGPRSQAALVEVEKLQAGHAAQVTEVERLEAEVQERQVRLDAVRATGVVGKVDAGVVTAFEKELKDLVKKLAEARSTLTGLEVMLDQARAELAEAQRRDAEEALTTKELDAAKKDLEKNAKAVAETHKAFLGALEAGAGALMAEAGPPWEEWKDSVKERRELYGRLCSLTGGDPDRLMLADKLATLYGDDVNPAILDLCEMLLDLVEAYRGWPRVRGRPRQRVW